MVWDGRNWRDSRVQSWNVTLEREVMKDTTLRLSYLGQHGSGLEQRFSLNQQESEYNYVARTGQAPPSNRDLLRVNKDWNPAGLNKTGYSNANGFQVESGAPVQQGSGVPVVLHLQPRPDHDRLGRL